MKIGEGKLLKCLDYQYRRSFQNLFSKSPLFSAWQNMYNFVPARIRNLLNQFRNAFEGLRTYLFQF